MTEIVLSEGSFAGSSCVGRSAILFIIGIALTLLYGAVSGYRALYGEAQKTTKIGNQSKVLLGKTEMIVVTSVAALVLLFAGSVFALSRGQIVLVATETTIVEHYCSMGRTYVEIFDKQKLKIVYVAKRGKSDYDWLEVRQPGKRTARIELSDHKRHSVIAKIAPEAMKAYADTLASEGKPLPAALKELAKNRGRS